MRFIVDECIGYSVALWLRKEGYDVAIVSEEASGITDTQVLDKAVSEGRILVTNDTDFGELVFRGHKEHRGIILFRLEDDFPQTIIKAFGKILSQYAGQLSDNFVVVSEKSMRIIPKK